MRVILGRNYVAPALSSILGLKPWEVLILGFNTDVHMKREFFWVATTSLPRSQKCDGIGASTRFPCETCLFGA